MREDHSYEDLSALVRDYMMALPREEDYYDDYWRYLKLYSEY